MTKNKKMLSYYRVIKKGVNNMRTREVLTISVPIGMTKEIQKTCRTEHKSRSQLFRDALQSYFFTHKWRAFQNKTIAKARALGIYSEDDIEKTVNKFRSES